MSASHAQIARPEPVGREAAHQPRPAEIRVEDAHALAAPRGHVPGLGAAHRHHVAEQVVIIPRFAAGLEEIDVAADAGEILLELHQQSAGRVADIVERVVGQRIADLRHPHRPAQQRLLDGARDLAVGYATAV